VLEREDRLSSLGTSEREYRACDVDAEIVFSRVADAELRVPALIEFLLLDPVTTACSRLVPDMISTCKGL